VTGIGASGQNGRVIANAPEGQVEVPRIVTELAARRSTRAVWRNELDGLTFQLGEGDTRQFVKWNPTDSGIDLSAEVARLCWAAAFVVVPRVLADGADDTGSWLLTQGLAGEMAVSDQWRRDPATAVRAIGAGLRAMHDALPVAQCPFDWSAEKRVAAVRARATEGRLDPGEWPEELRHLGSVERALEAVADIPTVDQLVVCHGDACAPNTLIGPDGSCVGHVDLGALGVADRWADLAIATWSTQWNYGPGWEEPLLAAYGIAPDPVRTSYYRRLWALSD
jgi:kanamycin kinase